jgi:glycine betaine/proline transport system substrate-binding protein
MKKESKQSQKGRRKMINLTKKITSIILCMGLIFASSQVLAKDSSKPIVIPVHNWSSQVVMAHVIGGIFKSMGNNVKYVPADSQAVYEAIRIGDVTLSHEVWQSSFGKSFQNAVDKGGVLDWGTHAAATLEEMGVPTWVIKKNLCPGLPDWKALKNCHKVFATPDSGGKGRWLEGPQSWHKDLMPTRVKALGLGDKYVVKFAGGADALWADLASAKKEGRATIIFNWTPNFTDAEGFTFIEFPPYKKGCRVVDGGDGSCGSPKGWLKKAINADFAKTHPKAAAMFKKLSFTTKDIGQMAALVDIDKLSHEDAAKKWLADHKNVWEKFLP